MCLAQLISAWNSHIPALFIEYLNGSWLALCTESVCGCGYTQTLTQTLLVSSPPSHMMVHPFHLQSFTDSMACPIQSLQSGYRYIYLAPQGKMASSNVPYIFVRICVGLPCDCHVTFICTISAMLHTYIVAMATYALRNMLLMLSSCTDVMCLVCSVVLWFNIWFQSRKCTTSLSSRIRPELHLCYHSNLPILYTS